MAGLKPREKLSTFFWKGNPRTKAKYKLSKIRNRCWPFCSQVQAQFYGGWYYVGNRWVNFELVDYFFCHAILRFILRSWFAGLLKTNTIMFGESGGRGLFPMFSLMNHSCRLEASTYKHSMLKCTVHTFLWNPKHQFVEPSCLRSNAKHTLYTQKK